MEKPLGASQQLLSRLTICRVASAMLRRFVSSCLRQLAFHLSGASASACPVIDLSECSLSTAMWADHACASGQSPPATCMYLCDEVLMPRSRNEIEMGPSLSYYPLPHSLSS